jgi:hypothetical protein
MSWEMEAHIEKILCAVLHEAHGRQVVGDDGNPLRGAGGLLRRLAALNGSIRQGVVSDLDQWSNPYPYP